MDIFNDGFSGMRYLKLAPVQITANQNDYDIQGYSFVAFTTDASRDITGFIAPGIGHVLEIFNAGTFNIVLKHQNAGSTGTNRMKLGAAAADITITPGNSVTLVYGGTTNSRWDLLSKSF